MMKVTIFGTGYVGLVTGACLAEMGNHVLCVDIDADKVACLERGEIPIYEPGLEPIVRSNRAGRAAALHHRRRGRPSRMRECIFIAVGTPPDEDGSADLQVRAGRGAHHRSASGSAYCGGQQVDRAGGHGRPRARGHAAERLPRAARRSNSTSCPTPNS